MPAYAAADIRNAQDNSVIASCLFDSHSAAFRRELNGVIDKVRDRLKQPITVAAHTETLVSHQSATRCSCFPRPPRQRDRGATPASQDFVQYAPREGFPDLGS
jgi:hypothetical protein